MQLPPVDVAIFNSYPCFCKRQINNQLLKNYFLNVYNYYRHIKKWGFRGGYTWK